MIQKMQIFNPRLGMLCEGEWPFRTFPRSGDFITDDIGDEHEVDFLIFERKAKMIKIMVKPQ